MKVAVTIVKEAAAQAAPVLQGGYTDSIRMAAEIGYDARQSCSAIQPHKTESVGRSSEAATLFQPLRLCREGWRRSQAPTGLGGDRRRRLLDNEKHVATIIADESTRAEREGHSCEGMQMYPGC